MKRYLSLVAIAALSTGAFASDDLAAMKAELQALKAQVADLKKVQESSDVAALATQLKELKTRTGGDNLKWDADYRTSYDSLQYNLADGSKASNSSLLTNRLWLGFKAAPRSDLSLIGQLSYNKVFGDTANHSQSNTAGGSSAYSTFDWMANEYYSDNTIKVKTAYAIYFGKLGDVDYSASIGRRSSTNGTLANLRSDDKEASPNGHMINVEFDGASFNFQLEKVTSVPGMAFKLCMGQGLTNAKTQLDSYGLSNATDKTKNETIDMFGFIFTPYDNGQYRVTSQVFKAWNLIGFTNAAMGAYGMAAQGLNPLDGGAHQLDGVTLGNAATSGVTAAMIPSAMQAYAPTFQNFGGMYGYTVSAIATGIGSGLGDFADNTTAFASWAMSKTDPKGGMNMLGSSKAVTGQSWWVGVQMPAMITKDGRIGLEYNKGSKYWRSFTYAEDTAIGSKLAARGSAKEIYFIQPILGKTLTAELRYTHIDYDYTGSNSFFGEDGTPNTIADALAAAQAGMGAMPIKSATDMMGYLRYRY